jgi:dihydrofolate synthase/folylpolyglutamate synthase
VAGRLQRLAGDPPTVIDGAHNPDAIAALLESLPEVLPAGAPLALVLGVLEDKDAAAMLAPLLEVCERAWFTAPPSSRALSPAALQSLARQLGFEDASCEPDPARALEAARAWALERGASVLATGSVYLVGDLLARQRSSATIGGTQADSRRSTR